MKAIKNLIIILFLSIIMTQGAYSEEITQPQNSAENQTNSQSTPENPQILTETVSTNAVPTESTTAEEPSEIPLELTKEQVPISLDESLKTALDKNYNIKIVTTQKNQSKWIYYNGLSDYLPDVSFNYNQTRLGGTFLFSGVVLLPITTTSFNTGFTAQWEGFTGFRRYFNNRALSYNYKATNRNLDLSKDQTILLTTVQYYTLLQNKFNIEILKKALEQTEAQLKINQQRFDAGVGTKFDVIRAESEVASARQNLISAYDRLRLSQAQLANTIGVDVFTPLVPSDQNVDAKTLFKGCFDLNTVSQIAIQNKPEIDIAKFNIAASRARRNSGYSIYSPIVAVSSSINASGTHINDLNQNQSVSLIVSWQGGQNLGLGGFTGIKALNEQVKEAKYRLINAERNVEQSIANSYYNTITAKELIQAAQKQVIAAEESLRLATVRLEAGVGIYTDVINAQLTETNARINYLNAIINYNISQTQLLFDMGVISANNVLEGFEINNELPQKKKK